MLGVDSGLAARDQLGRVRAPLQRLLGPRRARAQHVEAQPRDDGRQPPPEVLDSTRVRAADPDPGFLNGVVGLAPRAEHPVGDRPQVTPVLFESLRQPFVFVHRSHSLGHTPSSRSVIHSDEGNPTNVTGISHTISSIASCTDANTGTTALNCVSVSMFRIKAVSGTTTWSS